MIEEWEKKTLLEYLTRSHYNINLASKLAGMDRANFVRIMRRAGIKRMSVIAENEPWIKKDDRNE